MKNEFFVSKCCRAEAQIVFSDFPDFIGDDPKKQKVGTSWFRCTKCDKPCDILPLEEVFKKEEPEKDLWKWSLTITHVDNGYLLEGLSSNMGVPMSMVIEDDEEDELKSHESLLWQVMEYFNFGGSKHDPVRLRIIREKKK